MSALDRNIYRVFVESDDGDRVVFTFDDRSEANEFSSKAMNLPAWRVTDYHAYEVTSSAAEAIAVMTEDAE